MSFDLRILKVSVTTESGKWGILGQTIVGQLESELKWAGAMDQKPPPWGCMEFSRNQMGRETKPARAGQGRTVRKVCHPQSSHPF